VLSLFAAKRLSGLLQQLIEECETRYGALSDWSLRMSPRVHARAGGTPIFVAFGALLLAGGASARLVIAQGAAASPDAARAVASQAAAGQVGVDREAAAKTAAACAPPACAILDTRESTLTLRSVAQLPATSLGPIGLGNAIAFSADGATLAIGAQYERSPPDAPERAEIDQPGSGAVFVYKRGASGWVQAARLKGTTGQAKAGFGAQLALNAGGNVLAVGAPGDDAGGGVVYVFRGASDGSWKPVARLTAMADFASFGTAVALNAAGDLLAVGAPDQDNTSAGEDVGPAAQEGDKALASGVGSKPSAPIGVGSVYLYRPNKSGTWEQRAQLSGMNADIEDRFGSSLALNGEGSVLAVGATQENVSGDLGSGAVYVFRQRAAGRWQREAYVRSPTPAHGDDFGFSVALDNAGNVLAVGAMQDDGIATNAGAVFIFRHEGVEWKLETGLKSPHAAAEERFGKSVALDANGSLMMSGSPYELRPGLKNSRREPLRGAAYAFRRDANGKWAPVARVVSGDGAPGDMLGWFVAMAPNARTFAVAFTRDKPRVTVFETRAEP